MMNPFDIQQQVMRNNQELHDYLKDLQSWESDAKSKDAGLREGKLRMTKQAPKAVRSQQASVPVPDNSEVNMKIYEDEKKQGNEAYKKKAFEVAIAHYAKCINACPQETTGYVNRAQALFQLKRFAEAEDDCSAALHRDKALVKASYWRAKARKELNKLSDLDKALRADPKNKEARALREEVLAIQSRESEQQRKREAAEAQEAARRQHKEESDAEARAAASRSGAGLRRVVVVDDSDNDDDDEAEDLLLHSAPRAELAAAASAHEDDVDIAEGGAPGAGVTGTGIGAGAGGVAASTGTELKVAGSSAADPDDDGDGGPDDLSEAMSSAMAGAVAALNAQQARINAAMAGMPTQAELEALGLAAPAASASSPTKAAAAAASASPASSRTVAAAQQAEAAPASAPASTPGRSGASAGSTAAAAAASGAVSQTFAAAAGSREQPESKGQSQKPEVKLVAPKTSADFDAMFRSSSGDAARFGAYLKYPKLLKSAVEASLLQAVVAGLHATYLPSDVAGAQAVLEQMEKLPRFEINVAFLEDSDKSKLAAIFKAMLPTARPAALRLAKAYEVELA